MSTPTPQGQKRRLPQVLGILGCVLLGLLFIESADAQVCAAPNGLCDDCPKTQCPKDFVVTLPATCCPTNYACIGSGNPSGGAYCKFVNPCSGGQVYDAPTSTCVCPSSKPDFSTGTCMACPSGSSWNGSQCAPISTCPGNQVADKIGNCACPTSLPYWNTSNQQCELCPTATPVWNTTKSACEACPASTPAWNATKSACEACSASTPVWNVTTSACEACPASTSWNGTKCEAATVPDSKIKSPLIRGDCRGEYGILTQCQSGWDQREITTSLNGTVVPNNTDCVAGENRFIGDPNQCSGKTAGTLLPGSCQISKNVGFCGALVCNGGSTASCDLTGASGQRTNCAGNAVDVDLDFSDPSFTHYKCLKSCQSPQVMASDGKCVCPTAAAPYWDGTTCTTAPVLADHTCGLDSPGILEQKLTSLSVANPKLACCTRGWATDKNPKEEDYRLDCAESVTGLQTFNDLYNAPGGDSVVDAGLTNPNRLFLLDPVSKIPISGFYNSKGQRCGYLTSTGATTLSISAQFALFQTAITTGKVPAEVPNKDCTRLVRQALEVRCPPNPGRGAKVLTYETTSGGKTVRRCIAAGRLVVHTDIRDLISSATSFRGVSIYQNMTTYSGGMDALPSTVRGYILPKEMSYSQIIDAIYRKKPTRCNTLNQALTTDNQTGFCEVIR